MELKMTEPTSTAVGAWLTKVISSTPFAVGVAAALVMCLTEPPKTKKRMFAMLLSTFFTAYYGSEFVISYFHLEALSQSAKSFITIVCGIPGWAIMNGFFLWAEDVRGKGFVGRLIDKWLTPKGE